MNIGRIFAHAVVRRIAYLVVAMVAALLVQCFGEARAQSHPIPVECPNPSAGCGIEQAWAECAAWPAADLAAAHPADWVVKEQCNEPDPTPSTPGGTLRAVTGSGTASDKHTQSFSYVSDCPIGTVWDPVTLTCGSCASKPPLTGGWAGADGNADLCKDECEYHGGGLCVTLVIDGQSYDFCSDGFVPTGDTCPVGGTPPTQAPDDGDGDGASDENDEAPNNPGDTGGEDPNDGDSEDGDEDGSETCGGPGQPVCDGTNGGSGNGNTSGGGGNCQMPPHSSGDAILAQIAFQAWATRCAVEAQGAGGGGTGPGEGEGDQPEWTEGDGPALPEDTTAEDVENASSWGVGLSTDLLDTENIFGESSCPQLPEFSVMGFEIDTGSFTWWCTLISIMRAAILVMGAFTALQILMGRM